MPGFSEQDIPCKLRLELPRLKREHNHVYAVETTGGIFALRPLTWNEFKFVKGKVQAEVLPEASIVKTALVWPDVIPDDAPAGVIPTLALAVLNISGFENEEAIEASFAYADHQLDIDPEHHMIMVICMAFPAYKPEDLYELQFLDLVMRFKQAKRMLGPTVAQEEEPPTRRRRRREREPGPPIQELNEDVMTFGVDEEFVPEPATQKPGVEPMRDPNLPPPNFKRDNDFFRKNFVNALTQAPNPNEV